MPTFKPGDKVRRKEGSADCSYPQKFGVIYTVKYSKHHSVLFIGDDWASGCFCQDLWELVTEKTWDILSVGDWVEHFNGDIARVLTDNGGEGELRVFKLSLWTTKKDSNDSKKAGNSCTIWEMKNNGYIILQDTREEPIEITAEEAITAYQQQKGMEDKKVVIKK